MTPEEEIALLRAENAALREQNAVLLERVQHLEARLAQESHNRSKPPSSDGLARQTKTRSLRRKSGRKPGGPGGHRGETLRLVGTPDELVEHRPAVCAACQTALDDAPVVLRERRQVHELPRLRLVVREPQALQVRCPHCQRVTTGAFPAATPSRAQDGPRLRALVVYLVEQQVVPYGRVRELLADLFGAHLSLGTLVHWVQQGAARLEPVEAAIQAALQQAPGRHNDETGVRRAGTLAWAPVASTARLTQYALHAKRGTEATDAIGLVPDSTGVSMHDGWAPYWAYRTCRHARCTIHHLRALTFLEEQDPQSWAQDLQGLRLEMKTAVDPARAQGRARLPRPQRQAFVTRSQELMAAGLAAHPPPRRRPRQRGRVKQTPARNLLDRFVLGQDPIVAFLDDLTIPFDNNQAERDLRRLKVQQKVSGAFRADRGAEAFARIRGYLSTLAKQGGALLAALAMIFAGQPLYPEFA